MTIMIQAISSFVAALAFGILVKVPKNALIASGITGMVGWMINWLLTPYIPNSVGAIFLGSVGVAITSIIFARHKKMPATVFNIPGVFPLVPGILAFQTMNSFMNRQFMEGMEFMVKTFASSITIALAIVVTEIMYLLVVRIKRNYRQ
ncbi:threonine/serine exporter family protein [Erysipelothrix urinaevulpis]|uniref:threonine/serine exporter family protein n=1 Tax=Erysipelothrix urinaevulpis TaxID=2683717 RepID=UPI00135C1A7E|nr:threonine/serine exporter family protein [Erysipelothrix urinaevulpis]